MAYKDSQTWAAGSGAPGTAAYNSHFFSGQDVFVFLYPYYGKGKLMPLPCTQFQYGLSQQKQPIYGAWSYKWDAVAKGQKIVQGEFSVVYTKPNFIGQMLGTKDQSDTPYRDKNGGVKVLLDDDASSKVAERKNLRDSIWGASKKGEADPYLFGYSAASTKKDNEAFPFGRAGSPEADFCAHQPFDIIICYGDNPSMDFTDSSKFNYQQWANTTNEYMRMLATTQNEDGWTSSHRMRIENVELLSVGSVLEVSGQPLQETYSFMARDVTTPNVNR